MGVESCVYVEGGWLGGGGGGGTANSCADTFMFPRCWGPLGLYHTLGRKLIRRINISSQTELSLQYNSEQTVCYITKFINLLFDNLLAQKLQKKVF